MFSSSTSTVRGETHLVLIIDCSPPYLLLNSNQTQHYETWLNSVVTFANAHLLLDRTHRLTVIGSNFQKNEIIYPPSADGIQPSPGGQYELLWRVTDTIKTRTRDLSNVSLTSTSAAIQIPPDPLISGALAIALACIKKRQKSRVESLHECNSRIAIISPNPDTVVSYASQYMNLMNVFFTAQKMGIRLDVCVLGEPHETFGSTLLEQGADLTEGLYLRVPFVKSLVQYLNWTILPSAEVRRKLVLPTRKKISLRAACFCHRNLIEMSYVCSVCLSIFCTYSPFCSTCSSHFKLTALIPPNKNGTDKEKDSTSSEPNTPKT